MRRQTHWKANKGLFALLQDTGVSGGFIVVEICCGAPGGRN